MDDDPRQFELATIRHQYQGELIQQRAKDGYINATAMCQAAGKNWADYYRLAGTQAYLKALSADMGYPISDVIQSLRGGLVFAQGTWVHPQVAIHLAQWLSPEFAVQVSKWVYEWMSGMGSPVTARRSTPVFVTRFNLNWDRTESGYFSVISELFIRVYGRLEQLGHVLPDKAPDGTELRPDISVGKTFPKWLKGNHPGLVDKYKEYSHLLTNRNVVPARQYHNSALAAFIDFIDAEWLPNHAHKYFKERDPAALTFLPKLLAKPKKDD